MQNICDILSCPVCGGVLVREGGSLVCCGGIKKHTYDVSREGYVNLLPPGKGKNARTGDEVAMIRARSAFLSLGAYDGLSDEIARLILTYSVDKPRVTVVDSGCGEGYHTVRIVKALADNGKNVLCAAFDASKHGAAAGAKASFRANLSPKGGVGADFDGQSQALFMTGNIFSLPLFESSADFVISMFAPIAWEENFRILKKGGHLIVAASGIDHLSEMRSVIYDDVIKKAPDVQTGEGFSKVGNTSVRYTASLKSSDEIMNLFGMTPFCYRTPREAVERLRAKKSLDVTVNTDYFVFRKL